MFTLAGTASARQEIKKSRFLAVAGPIASEAEARAFLDTHADASAGHNCWAWRVGAQYRFNDDGEPSGTAGKPILQAIDGQNLDGVAVVVSRWFGGILLGSGGLMRAYGGTAAQCLREAEKIALIETVSGSVACAFGDLALLQARLASLPSVRAIEQSFTDEGPRLGLTVEKDSVEAISDAIRDLTSGRASADWDI
ncbi:YigZ family protein [Salmonella enterica subsp. enterica]|nr:YigZ family protein [Salmonella enterica subsp. enterica serovar Paratyphi A]MIL09068.1 YigZ family protein [Salmonella enterica subsp. enterica serovar Enteritidis]